MLKDEPSQRQSETRAERRKRLKDEQLKKCSYAFKVMSRDDV